MSATSPNPFRFDIEGLRAVAVIAVLLYHARINGAGGGYVGVDVFFVISGFLITGLLIREAEATGTISLRTFYARRIRRLLPASIVALAATSIITLMLLPRVRWMSVAGDLAASAAYVVNWRFAGRAVDYLAEGSAASPVQHFWSLAVEEQFYVMWPLLILLAGVMLRARFDRRAVAIALAFVAGLSFLFSLVFTSASANEAYFVTTTRVWELGLGAGLALAVPKLEKLRRPQLEVIGWAGIGAIALATVTFGAATPFPSYTALLPTLGASGIIAAGVAGRRTTIGSLLSSRPLVWIGGLSYSLYLYHWPMVVGAEGLLGAPLSPSVGLAVVTAAIVPAWLSLKYVENPIRHARSWVSPPTRALKYGLALTLTGVMLGGAIVGVARLGEGGASGAGSVLAIESSFVDSLQGIAPPGQLDGSDEEALTTPSRLDASMIPDRVPEALQPPLTRVVDDVPSVYSEGCHQGIPGSEPKSCVFGLPDGEKVALVGDSHAVQWIPALEQVALERGWQLITFTKSGCPFGSMTAMRNDEVYRSCIDWNHRVMEELTDLQPAMVLASSSTSNLPARPDGSAATVAERSELFIDGLQESTRQLVDAAIPVVLIADTPRPIGDIPECLSTTTIVANCSNPIDRARSPGFARVVALGLEGVTVVDMIPWICTSQSCPPIVEDVIVWRDSHHLTATYSRLLTGPLSHLLPQTD